MVKKTIYFGNPAYLSMALSQLKVEQPGVDPLTVPIEDIGLVIVDHPQVTLTSPLILALLNKGTILWCDGSHLPYGIAVPLYGHTTFQKHFRAQIQISVPKKKQLWQQTVRAKIEQQAHLLSLIGEHETPLLKWSSQVKSGDVDNKEAQAAVYYWARLFYNGFVRDRDESPPNDLLNYGYAVLRAIVARALVSAGLSPSIGIFHRNQYNPLCLADDIMEPYRPFVDGIVLELWEKTGPWDQLEKSHKKAILKLPEIDVKINNRISPLSVAVQRTTASLAQCLLGEKRNISYPT